MPSTLRRRQNVRSFRRSQFLSAPAVLLSTLMTTSSAQLTTSTPTSPVPTPASTLSTIVSSPSASDSAGVDSTIFALDPSKPTARARPESGNSAASSIYGSSFPSSAPSSQPDDDGDDQKSGLLNYYFVFLALFILLLFLGLYYLHRRKRARKARYRHSGQNALARDLDGWVGTRRWVHGTWRSGETRQEREEGLNELGEAPPPYIAKGAQGHSRNASADDADGSLQIPLRSLSRNEGERSPGASKLPDYGEVLRASRIETGTEDEELERPPTAFPSASSFENGFQAEARSQPQSQAQPQSHQHPGTHS